MPGPYIQPDPDLRVAESNSAPALRAEAGRLLAAENDVARQINAIAATNEGRGVEHHLERLEATKAGLDKAAVVLTRTAELHEALAAAAATYRREAPTGLEIFAAWAVAEKIRSEVAAHAEAGGPEYLAAKKEQRRAQKELDDLERRRAEAIAAFEDARGVALEKFRGQVPDAPAVEVGGETPLGTPAPRTATSPTPAQEAPAPAPTPLPMPVAPAELPGATAPLATAPATALSAAGTGSSGLTPAQAAVLGAALSQQQGQSQQQPVQIPAPMPAPALTPPQQPRRAEDPFADYDPNAVLAGLARGDFRPTTATVAAPAITPLNPPPPTFTPLSPGSSLSGLVPVNPVVAQPVVTGTSTAGLITDNNVSGRPDGATARTATSPGPATNLSGASADQTTARPAATGAGTGMGGVPMMGPMMGGMGGAGAGKDRDPVTATMTPEQAKLLGLEAIGEAVPGGTIARKED